MPAIIAVEGLRKSLHVAQREAGMHGTLRHLLRRHYRQVVRFRIGNSALPMAKRWDF
jgi:ABC-type uncharacterized transport system ATPase subunit